MTMLIFYVIMGICSCVIGHWATKDMGDPDIKTRLSSGVFYLVLFLFWPIVFLYVAKEELESWR